jgi:hypothetical protein
MLPADHFLAIDYCTTSVPVFTRKPESAVNSSRPTACGFAHSGVGLIQYQDSDTSLRTRGDKQYARQAPHAGWGNRIDFLPPLRWGNCNNSRSSYCQWDKEVSQPETVGMHLPASNDALRSQPRPVHPPDPIAGRGHMIPAHETGIKTAASFYPRKITAGLVKSFVPCPSWTRETRGRAGQP